MRIALFTDTFLPQINGVVTAVVTTVKELVQQGHKVAVFTVKVKDGDADAGLPAEVKVYRFRSLALPTYPGLRVRLPTFAPTLRNVRQFAPHIIHSHTLFGVGWEAVLAARRLRVPLIGTHHAFLDEYMRHVKLRGRIALKVERQYTRLYYNRCRVIITPSHALAQDLRLHSVTRPIVVIPNPLKIEEFSGPPRTSIQRSASAPHPTLQALYFGRLSYEKSIAVLLHALARVRDQNPEAAITMKLVGDGPERRRLESLAVELHLGDRVQFLGSKRGQELVDAVQSSDVFMSASTTENLPMTFLEAMAAGLPIIGARARGVPEIVEHLGNGLLVEPGSAEEFADAMLRLYADQSLRSAFALRSRELVKRYDAVRVISELIGMYEKVLTMRAPGA